ncbi:RNA-binding protein 39-like [Acanthaster planci]|uniref:RNA-binding protein 39-like n=1 Tax=Acanthaster planci TaxID=133434 RepID=A0A8B7YHW5_ACAPL|nr:RNA-binding protein 39-like [Acanthaster planci]
MALYGEDLDVEALLEAPYKNSEEEATSKNGVPEKEPSPKKKHRSSRSRSRSPPDSKDKDKHSSSSSSKKSSSRRRSRSRSPERKRRSRSPDRRRRSRSRSRDRSTSTRHDRDRDRDRGRGLGRYGRQGKRSPTPPRRGRRSRSKERSPHRDPFHWRRSRSRSRDRYGKRGSSPGRKKDIEPPPETRDARTVFVMQLSQRVRAKDLEEFFSSVGKVRDVKIISDRNSRRSKGIGYVEFMSDESVPLAMGLNNEKLMGVPIVVQPSQAEKNRLAQNNQTLQKGGAGPMRLYVGSLHYNITEEMLRGIFEPFGQIDSIQLMTDSELKRSKGYGFITFHDADDAKRALDQLNGFELAGRPMKVNHVTERSDNAQATSVLDNDELERTGIELTTTGRLQLMAKLAEGTGFQLPSAVVEALNPLANVPTGPAVQTSMLPSVGQVSLQAQLAAAQQQAAALASQVAPTGTPAMPAAPAATNPPCFMLSNMFDPTSETSTNWETEIRDDVIEECNKHGGVLHIHVDRTSPQGNCYVKCPNAQIAVAAVNSLHGRWFAGKMITAAFVPLANYHAIFPESAVATTLLQPSLKMM